MKKLYYLGAITGLILTSCANDDLVNDPGTNPVPNDGAIAFNMRLNNQTRAGLEGTYDNFGVFAFKTTAAKPMSGITAIAAGVSQSDQVVMNNYCVNFVEDVEFYGSHWTYVSDQWPGYTGSLKQSLKYWDGSYTNTYFFPYAPFKDDQTFANATAGATMTFAQMQTAVNVDNDFVYADVTKANNAEYINKANGTVDNPKKVPLTFRRGVSKVKIAFHENIPGYSVVLEKVKFKDEAETDGVAAIPADYNGTVWTRGYYVDKATPVVTYDAANDYQSRISYTGAVTSQDNIIFSLPGEDDATNTVSTAHDTATELPSVYTVVPNDGINTILSDESTKRNSGLQFVVNYKLVSEDSNEVIHVKGARVYVTPQYTAWAPNTVYTYVFLITRNSSGTTTGDDPDPDPKDPEDALYPIIFDGVEIEEMSENNSEWIINGLQLSETEVNLTVGHTFTLTSSLNGVTCQTVTWSIKEGKPNDVVSIDSSNGLITALKPGSTIVVATVQDSGHTYTAECTINVAAAPATPEPEP